jgi:hypothetical protein
MRLPVADDDYCLRFSAGSFIAAALAHALLGVWLNSRPGEGPAIILVPLFLFAPYAVLAAVTWVIRSPWILSLVVVVLLLLEASVLTTYLSSTSSTGGLGPPLFGILASCFLVPIALIVAIVRYFLR